MIQRPQTVFLLLGAALLVLFAALTYTRLPVLATPGTGYTWLTVAVAALAATVALVAVFLYKNRPQQRKVVAWAQGLALMAVIPVFAALLLSQPVSAPGSVPSEATAGPYLSAFMPLAAFVLLRMARRGVDRDIATVRSMDRLR